MINMRIGSKIGSLRRLTSRFGRTKDNCSLSSSETGYKWNYKITKKKKFPMSNWIIVLFPVALFLAVGIYFILVDLKIVSSLLHWNLRNEKSNLSEISWPEDFNESNSSLTDFITINDDASVTGNNHGVEILESTSETSKSKETSNDQTEKQTVSSIPVKQRLNITKSKDTIVVLEKEGDRERFIIERIEKPNATSYYKNPTEFIEVVSPPNFGNVPESTEEIGFHERYEEIIVGNVSSHEWPTLVREPEVTLNSSVITTPKVFLYSPTIPQVTSRKNKVDVTTDKYNQSEVADSSCFSTKLQFCEGILPYDMVQLPSVPGIRTYNDLTSMLPYFQLIIDSKCSLRAKEFICSVLEPECQPYGYKQTSPCKLNCKVVADECKNFILEKLPLSKLFDCRRYPDWDENRDCVNLSKGQCYNEEFQCPDGSCIPSKWVCDGVHDCPGSRPGFDEQNCQNCSQNEFRCISDGKCIPLHWKCDEQVDCTDESDELTC